MTPADLKPLKTERTDSKLFKNVTVVLQKLAEKKLWPFYDFKLIELFS